MTEWKLTLTNLNGTITVGGKRMIIDFPGEHELEVEWEEHAPIDIIPEVAWWNVPDTPHPRIHLSRDADPMLKTRHVLIEHPDESDHDRLARRISELLSDYTGEGFGAEAHMLADHLIQDGYHR